MLTILWVESKYTITQILTLLELSTRFQRKCYLHMDNHYGLILEQQSSVLLIIDLSGMQLFMMKLILVLIQKSSLLKISD